MASEFRGIDTKLIHADEPQPRILGAVAMPICQSATFEIDEGEPGLGYPRRARYIRLTNTPTHVALHEKIAALENAEAALVTASGMAAITASLLTVLSPGDRVLAHECLSGGTHGFLSE